MSATHNTDALAGLEELTQQISCAITTLGQLLPSGMAVTVSHPLGGAAVCSVVYPDGSIATKEFQGGSIH